MSEIKFYLLTYLLTYLSGCQQYVSINGYDSGLTELNCGVPQGSVPAPLLFLLYINDPTQAIKFCKVHQKNWNGHI